MRSEISWTMKARVIDVNTEISCYNSPMVSKESKNAASTANKILSIRSQEATIRIIDEENARNIS